MADAETEDETEIAVFAAVCAVVLDTEAAFALVSAELS
jgi:hypothetical protein